jgi:hypothetical protein
MYTIHNDNPDLAELLLAYGASPYETNDFGLSAIDAAFMVGNDAILALMIPEQPTEPSEAMEEAAILLTKEEAFSFLLSSKNLQADPEDITQGAVVVDDEYSIHALDDVKINDTVLYLFESVSLGETGAATTYIVSSKTANIYFDYLDVIMSEFEFEDFDYEIIDGEKVYVADIVSLGPNAYNFCIHFTEDGRAW